MVALPPLPLFGILSNTRWAVLRMASTVPRSCGGGSARSWRASARRTSSLHDGSYSPCTCSRRRAGEASSTAVGKEDERVSASSTAARRRCSGNGPPPQLPARPARRGHVRRSTPATPCGCPSRPSLRCRPSALLASSFLPAASRSKSTHECARAPGCRAATPWPPASHPWPASPLARGRRHEGRGNGLRLRG